jgi:hypothetical protein
LKGGTAVVRVLGRTWSKLKLDWEIGLHRLPFFTQKTAVLLVGVLVATLALLGGVISLIGPPESIGPARLDPGGSARKPTATTRPAADRAGGGSGAAGVAGDTPARLGTPTRAQTPGRATGTAGPAPDGSAGQAGGGGATAPTTTLGPSSTDELLPPVEDLLGTVVSTLLPPR